MLNICFGVSEMKKLAEYISVLCVGSASYSIIEVVWRGFTHWTMSIVGGVCMLLIYVIGSTYESTTLWKKCIAGSLVITNAELIVGFLVNILLGWSVWSYSGMRFNFYGLVCPLYTLLWFFLCIPANIVCDLLRRGFRGEKRSS